jgi:hypothetical protein
MTFVRSAATVRRRPPFLPLAAALCAAASTAFARDATAPSVLAIAQLELAAEPDALATASIELSRAGAPGRRLAFRVLPSSTSCDSPSPIAWLVAEPSTGEIASGAVAVLSVYASAFGVSAARRTGFLCVATDDEAHAPREIVVVLTIEAAAAQPVAHAPVDRTRATERGAGSTDESPPPEGSSRPRDRRALVGRGHVVSLAGRRNCAGPAHSAREQRVFR